MHERSIPLTLCLCGLLAYHALVAVQWAGIATGLIWVNWYYKLDSPEAREVFASRGTDVAEIQSAIKSGVLWCTVYSSTQAVCAPLIIGVFCRKKLAFWLYCVAVVALALIDVWGGASVAELSFDCLGLAGLIACLHFAEPRDWPQSE